MDTPHGTGRHLVTPATSVYLIDDLADSNTGSQRPELGDRVWSGTFEYCWRAATDAGAVGKMIFPITSGTTRCDASIPGQQGTTPVDGYWGFYGQTAPSPGFFLRGTRASINGASNVAVMHLRSYAGDDSGGLGADNRDCFNSGYAGGTCTNIVVIGCEFGFSVDELCDFIRSHHLVSWVYNVFTDPLHDSTIEHPGDPTNTDHGFSAVFGGDSASPQSGSFSCFRNVFAHGTGRGPATTAQAFCATNNLYYNQGGRPGGGDGEAIDIWSQFATEPSIANILYNWFIRGPEHTNSLVAVRVRTGAQPGPVGYLLGNAAHGWAPVSQASFLNSAVVGYQQLALTAAIPGSWNSLTGVKQSIPTTADDWLELIDLMEESCGAQPAFRSSSYGRAANTFTQMRNRVNGVSSGFQFINTVDDAGGWWTVPETLINPADPGSHWDGEPMPLGSDRDQILGTGTFANGQSMAGRTRLEAWMLKRYYQVGGK